ncbi:MAG: hypothetical protein KGL20_04920, partial [Rhodospirillales bacterium]|nr:hypothetical protein [Rhodospirillales bacterium]
LFAPIKACNWGQSCANTAAMWIHPSNPPSGQRLAEAPPARAMATEAIRHQRSSHFRPAQLLHSLKIA